MFLKSLFLWIGMIPLALLNWIFREELLNGWVGPENALWFSGMTVCFLVFIACLFSIPILGTAKAKTFWLVGLFWMVLTVLFKGALDLCTYFTFAEVLSTYDITSGNLWSFDVLFLGVLPWLTAKARGLIL
ncbi:hypothetical protein FACS1894181_13770 [Bacteroidia bacterium]|nr:hypothetical protein FACS189438_0630 [Bacteroidia bacterium]GHV51634.1 hypothetical protein FACS1894181_13770 [Bacteroidia bacterium]